MISHRSAAPADIPAILLLASCCEAADHLNRPLNEADLTSPLWGEVPASNWHLWHDDTGRLVAFARLRWSVAEGQPVEGRFWLYVHPDMRRQGIETDMIAWAETQTQAYTQAHHLPSEYRLFTAARHDKYERLSLLAEHGFRQVRYFFSMHRSFDVPLAKLAIPAGFTIRSVNPSQDIPAYVALGNAAFAEHWGHREETEAEMTHQMHEPGYRSDLDLLAIAAEGNLSGFCLCTLDEPFIHQQTGFVLGLGTHPRYRGMGLGRALLLSGLHRLQERGLKGADISVDGENPTGAVRLYESVGFVTYETWISFFRP